MRSRILGGAFIFCFLILLPGLFYTQVLKYNFYKELSERNRIRILPIEAPRGRIYDRNGKLLHEAIKAKVTTAQVMNEESSDTSGQILTELKGIKKAIESR